MDQIYFHNIEQFERLCKLQAIVIGPMKSSQGHRCHYIKIAFFTSNVFLVFCQQIEENNYFIGWGFMLQYYLSAKRTNKLSLNYFKRFIGSVNNLQFI